LVHALRSRCRQGDHYEKGTFTSIDFNPRAYSSRWYKTRTWVNADGHTAWLDSDGQYLGTVPE
jgi:hypothetical protein